MTEENCYVDKLFGDFMKFSRRIAPGEWLANGRSGTVDFGSSELFIHVEMLCEKGCVVRQIAQEL